MLVYLSIRLSIWLTVWLSGWLVICLSIRLFICLSIYLSVYQSVYLTVCLSIYVSVWLSVCWSVCVCVLTTNLKFYFFIIWQNQEENRYVYHFHFMSWTDRSMPLYGPLTLLGFLSKVHYYDDKNTGPLLVHCRYVGFYHSLYNYGEFRVTNILD